MNRGLSAVVAVWSAIALPGCGTSSAWQTDESVAPTTYSAVLADETRTIGNLRRVLIVPVDVFPVQCGKEGLTNWSITSVTLGSPASSFLTVERGYEVGVASDPEVSRKLGLTEGDLRQLVAPLRNCAADRSQWAPTPPSTREAAITLGRHSDVDAVLLVERAEVCKSNKTTLARELGLLPPEFSWNNTPGVPYTQYVRAAMFETTSGRLVWYRELSTGALWSKALAASSPFTAPRPYGGTGLPWSTISDEMKWLLEEIEPAIPQQITR